MGGPSAIPTDPPAWPAGADAARLLDDLAAGEVTEDASARASVAVAEAKILTSEIALNAAEKLFELAGSAATRAGLNGPAGAVCGRSNLTGSI